MRLVGVAYRLIITLTDKGIVSHGKEDTQSGLLENETIASIV